MTKVPETKNLVTKHFFHLKTKDLFDVRDIYPEQVIWTCLLNIIKSGKVPFRPKFKIKKQKPNNRILQKSLSEKIQDPKIMENLSDSTAVSSVRIARSGFHATQRNTSVLEIVKREIIFSVDYSLDTLRS